MKRLIFLILLGIGLRGAENPLERLNLAIWPEYDHSGVLVIYHGVIKDGFLPLSLRLQLPGEVSNAIVKGRFEGDSVVVANVIQEEKGFFISEQIKSREFVIEYYFNPFQKGNTFRHFNSYFTFPSGADSFWVFLQQPIFASDFRSSLKDFQLIQDQHRMVYQKAFQGSYSPGEKIPLEFQYTNPGNELSLEFLRRMIQNAQQGTSTEEHAEEKPHSVFPTTIWIFWIVLLLALLVLTYMIYQRRRTGD